MPRNASCVDSWTRLGRYGEELEWSPVVRFRDRAAATDQRKLCASQRRSRRLTASETGVEVRHQRCRGLIVHIPEAGDHAPRARAQECPGKSDETFTRVRAFARAAAGRHRYELGVKRRVRHV